MYIDVPRGGAILEVAMAEDHLLKGKTLRTLYMRLRADMFKQLEIPLLDLSYAELVTSLKIWC